MPPQSAYNQIERLVKKFKALPTRERHAYNEDNTRKDFILPLFNALEWDIQNAREVTAEEKISRGYVDFAFRIGGVPKFMLETKRIGEDLGKPEWSQQAIDYAYHKDVTWAVLSDFEGLKIINAEIKESNPLGATFKAFTVEDYLPRLDEVWLLSRPAFAEGLLDREAEKNFKRSIKTPITQTLFDNLTRWRKDLYKNLRAYNSLWSDKDIDDAVQRILDRLIFIRTAEDREVEGDKLMALVRELRDKNRLNDLIPALTQRFRQLDAIYNSELFAPHLCESLTYEPTVLVDIIEELYGSAASLIRTNFAFIDADVLGRAYEQYLGNVVAGRGVQLNAPTKSKRKSQGIYYTPTFVVKYIVQQTLGRYLDEHGYNPLRPLRVLDPACGSGSFLIEAFDVLDQFIARQMGQSHGAHDMHDYARHKQILSTNIFGVDKDAQAVEVAQLNLLLKALSHREKLPKLENIRCGDSLISGTRDELEKYFGANAKEKNAFNWEREFKSVVSEGGFDVIVGNPPYVNVFNLPPDEVDFYQAHYTTFKNKFDLYGFFLERAIKLLREGGSLGFIMSRTWLSLDSFVKLRQFLLESTVITQIALTPSETFADATVETAILIVRKVSDPAKRATHNIEIIEYDSQLEQFAVARAIPQRAFAEHPQFLFNLSLNESANAIFARLAQNTITLGELVSFSLGVKTADNDRFVRNRKEIKDDRPVLRGRDIFRYRVEFAGLWLRYIPDEIKKLHGARPRDPKSFLRKEKIVLREISSQEIIAAYDERKHIILDTANVIFSDDNNPYSLKFILSVLNSKLLNWWYGSQFKGLHVKLNQLTLLPIRRINFDDKQEKKQHDAIVALVEEMLELQKDYAEAAREKLPRADSLKRKIDAVDEEIDAAVYRLYDLTEEEIKTVEGK
ncbi:Type IIS restriction enzyme Eco57I [Anaerolineae bacterium]|nr:Type IIS restriction enzyme Eco57I [Anaerolineae bacterium]